MIENYVKFLEFIQNRLNTFFENQKEYIFCKKGCARCCKNAQFPYSLTEVQYLLKGAIELDCDIQEKIKENILNILKEKKNFQGKIFKYDCPFLIDNVCCVYEYRGIVCRTFGLVNQNPKDKDSKLKVPFCYKFGLNYSNVMDEKQNKITQEKITKAHTKEEPHGFNIDYHFLTGDDFERGFNFSFGEKKALIDWFYDFGWESKI